MAKTFHCTLVTPEQQVLDEQVTYASIPAHDGQIGVETRRAPLLVKLGHGVLRLDFEEGGSRYFFIGGGFAQMKDDKLSLLTNEAIASEDVIRQDAQARLAEAEERKPDSLDGVEARRREIDRAKTLIHLSERYGNKV